jgi:hypothetical protein
MPVLLLALMAAASPAQAADLVKDHRRADAEAALESYLGGAGTPSWPVEAVEIHASIPRLAKTGRLQAIRSMDRPGDVRYQIVQLTGDATVKNQVIARYLNAQERASQTTPSSVALTPANYKFAYRGIVDDGERFAYTFRISPRKKRDGLIKGEVWLDVGTGIPIRRSGYLVKRPSPWIKRVAVTQEDSLRDGAVQSRLTHIVVDTRLVGRAEMVISERPLGVGEAQQVVAWKTDGGQQ